MCVCECVCVCWITNTFTGANYPANTPVYFFFEKNANKFSNSI